VGYLELITAAEATTMLANAIGVIGSYNSENTENLGKVCPSQMLPSSRGNTGPVRRNIREIISGSDIRGNFRYITSWLTNNSGNTTRDALRDTANMDDLLVFLEEYIHNNVNASLRQEDFYKYNTDVNTLLQRMSHDIARAYGSADNNQVTLENIYSNLQALGKHAGLIR
jgi:4-hydroxy-3-methylbut-2-enyl diphosphate reductase IspH